MRIVFASYICTPKYKRPEDWIDRVKFYGGILEALALNHTVISIEQIDYEGPYQHNSVQYYFKRTRQTNQYFPIRINRFIKGLKPDIVFIHGLNFPLQVIQLRAFVGISVKIMVQHHAEQPANGIQKVLQQLADRYIDVYLFASRDLGLSWVDNGNLYSPQKIHEVMEVSSVFYPTDKKIAVAKTAVTGSPVFLWVGRLNQNKDPLNVVKTFLRFANSNTSARLYMIYHTDELLHDINKLLKIYPEVNNPIILIGKLSHRELLYWYNSADFIISGSFYEGSGTGICEAMSCGVIPIVTDIPSFRMITNNGEFGLLYDAGNEIALFNCLLKTMNINYDAMRQAILNHYHTNLSFAAIAGKISRIASSL